MPDHREQDKISDINSFMFKDLKKSEHAQPISSNQHQSAENDSELRILIQDIIIDNFDSESLNRTAFNSSVDILTAVDSHYRLRCQALEERIRELELSLKETVEERNRSVDDLTAQNQQMKKLIKLKDEYLQLILDELNEVVSIASIHGWKSTRFEQGKVLRGKIEALTKSQQTK
jgi:hypothetical protein